MQDELLSWRKEFPILEKTKYLVTHSLGAMPRQVYDRLKDYADTWGHRGVRAWHEGWWEIAQETGDLVGRIFNAPKGSVVMHQNVSSTVALIFSCFDWSKSKRNKIVSNDMEFPSVLYVCEEQTRLGANHHCVKSKDGLNPDFEAILSAIDETTQIVVVSLVFFRNAALADIDSIVKKAHSVGAYVLVDAYQGTGTVPFDVQKSGVDFYTGGSVKWVCGGPGAAYLYVNPKLIEQLEPKMTGWMAHQSPFAFETGRVRYAKSVYRFFHGTAGIPSLYAARSGYEIINKIGVTKIREKSLRQTQRIIDGAEKRGFKLSTPKPAERRGGSVSVDVPHGAAIVKALEQNEILCDYRPGSGIRLSPHFYSQDEEIEFALAEITKIIETKAYQPFLNTAVTH